MMMKAWPKKAWQRLLQSRTWISVSAATATFKFKMAKSLNMRLSAIAGLKSTC